MKIGVLAVQGAFIEHIKAFQALGAECVEIRQVKDLDGIHALVLPGGESTVQSQLLKKLDLFEPIQEKILKGLPTFATCAGLILLAKTIHQQEVPHLATLPVEVKRNAYGRQISSFVQNLAFDKVKDFPAIFIRAPYIDKISPEVKILAEINGNIVAVEYQNQVAMSFHPELSDDLSVHRCFLEKIKECTY